MGTERGDARERHFGWRRVDMTGAQGIVRPLFVADRAVIGLVNRAGHDVLGVVAHARHTDVDLAIYSLWRRAAVIVFPPVAEGAIFFPSWVTPFARPGRAADELGSVTTDTSRAIAEKRRSVHIPRVPARRVCIGELHLAIDVQGRRKDCLLSVDYAAMAPHAIRIPGEVVVGR